MTKKKSATTILISPLAIVNPPYEIDVNDIIKKKGEENKKNLRRSLGKKDGCPYKIKKGEGQYPSLSLFTL